MDQLSEKDPDDLRNMHIVTNNKNHKVLEKIKKHSLKTPESHLDQQDPFAVPFFSPKNRFLGQMKSINNAQLFATCDNSKSTQQQFFVRYLENQFLQLKIQNKIFDDAPTSSPNSPFSPGTSPQSPPKVNNIKRKKLNDFVLASPVVKHSNDEHEDAHDGAKEQEDLVKEFIVEEISQKSGARDQQLHEGFSPQKLPVCNSKSAPTTPEPKKCSLTAPFPSAQTPPERSYVMPAIPASFSLLKLGRNSFSITPEAKNGFPVEGKVQGRRIIHTRSHSSPEEIKYHFLYETMGFCGDILQAYEFFRALKEKMKKKCHLMVNILRLSFSEKMHMMAPSTLFSQKQQWISDIMEELRRKIPTEIKYAEMFAEAIFLKIENYVVSKRKEKHVSCSSLPTFDIKEFERITKRELKVHTSKFREFLVDRDDKSFSFPKDSPIFPTHVDQEDLQCLECMVGVLIFIKAQLKNIKNSGEMYSKLTFKRRIKRIHSKHKSE